MSLKDAIKEIQKNFGGGSIMKLGDKPLQIETISTGNVLIDNALGGGFPKGRISEIIGMESAGKSTLSLSVIAQAQKTGTAAIIDAEHALDSTYAKNLGVNIDELFISQPDSAEDALNIVETLLKSKQVSIIVVDSVAALTPRAEIEGEFGAANIGMQARLLSQAMRKLTALVSKTNSVLIFTNQIRMKIGVMFGSPEVSSGGLALKFFSSIRVDMRRIGTNKDSKGNVVSSQIKLKVIKSKVSPPFKEAEFSILYAEGIDNLTSLIDLAIEKEVIVKGGSWLKFDGETYQGKDKLREVLKQNQDLKEKLLTNVKIY